MGASDRPLSALIDAELAATGLRDRQLLRDLTDGLAESQAEELDAVTAAGLAMSVTLAARDLPSQALPAEREGDTFPSKGELQQAKVALGEARQDPCNIDNIGSRDLLRAALRPARKR